MNKVQEKKSGIPLIIIGIVFVVVVGLGYVWYTSSDSARKTTGRPGAAGTTRTTQPTANVPPGASLGTNVIGSPTAAVTIEEFADFQCGACAAVHPTVKEIQQIYGSRIRFIFRNFPLAIPAHDKAFDAAAAVEAAAIQGKFWAMQDKLFRGQQEWTTNQNYKQLWADYAATLGMDVEKFRTDMAGFQTKSRVEEDRKRGIGMNVSSTPSVFVNGILVPYPELSTQALRRIIDAELQKANAGNAEANSASNPAKSESAAPDNRKNN